MNKKKVVILVMCSSTLPVYKDLKNGIKETWFNHRNDDVEVIFYSDNVNYQDKKNYPILEGNDLILPCEDGVHNCGVKTILALDWISKNYEYDYIYRSNLGAYVNINNLLSFLSDKPKDKFYCGIFGFDNFYLNRPVKFVSGSGYFLSKDLVDLILNNKDLWNHRAIDDVALGDFMEKFNINVNESARRINICSGKIDYNIGDKFVETIPDSELYHFRLRSDNRDEDLKNMKEIHEKNNIENEK
jgi:hypothetical protein